MDVKELESKTVSELKEIAKEAGISGISSMKKADLISAIAAGAAPPDAEAPEESPAEDTAAQAPEAPAEEAGPAQETPSAPEIPEEEAGPAEEPIVEEPAAREKQAQPSPEPPKKAPAPQTKTSRVHEKYDVPALKQEKRGLKSRIQAAISEKDFDKVKELRSRKKELRRLLNRA